MTTDELDTVSPLDPAGPAEPTSRATGLTLVHGTTFCFSESGGDIAGAVHGFFAQDTRLLSKLRAQVGGRSPETLTALRPTPDSATVLARLHPSEGRHDSVVLLERRRLVADTLSESLVLRNYGAEALVTELRVVLETDFADLFAVKDGRARVLGTMVTPHQLLVEDAVSPTDLVPVLAYGAAAPGGDLEPGSAGLLVAASGRPRVEAGVLTWPVRLGARSEWSVQLEFRPEFVPHDGSSPASVRAARWLDPSSSVARPSTRISSISSTSPALSEVLACSAADLASLQLQLPGTGLPALAAGAPWFMALFGRDSLFAGYMALPLQPAVLGGALQTLAALQGRRTDPETEEQPGRILHELRLGRDSARALGGHCYYGTADATPLFAMMVAEAWRWGMDQTQVLDLLPAVDAALQWCRSDGDRDGDGFVDYERMTPRGLLNQGWKDSFDGISDATGAMPTYPVALCEVQAYRYRALLGRADLAEHLGDVNLAARVRTEAVSLREAFRARFWLPERGRPALALDGSGRALDALASNAAHCLWAELLDDDEAERVIAGLAGDDMDSGWGLRTLSASMGAYNPLSYHNGSVWPHDTAIAVAGLAAYRHVPGALPLAHRLTRGLLDAAVAFDGRPPELICGFPRSQYPTPVPYPTSCSPQAWASAAPLLLVRALLGLHPDVPARTVHLNPCLPPEWGTVGIEGLVLGMTTVTVRANGDSGTVGDLPAGWETWVRRKAAAADRPVGAP